MNLDEIFLKSYLNEYNDREAKKINHSEEDRLIAKEKQKKLSIIKSFLQRFVDAEIMVTHRDKYSITPNDIDVASAVPFEFYESESSKPWQPGISLMFDNPCEVEIAIPNKVEDGAVIIKTASHHPFSYILDKRYSSYESACEAIALFLSKCTARIKKDPTKFISKKNNSDPKREIDSLTSEIPEQPIYRRNQNQNKNQNLNMDKINSIFYSDKDKSE